MVFTVHEPQNINKIDLHDEYLASITVKYEILCALWVGMSCLLKRNVNSSPSISNLSLTQIKSICPYFYFHLHFRQLDIFKRITHVLRNGSSYQDSTKVHI